jgi:ATPase subunit of ABC transporter with duplicated ATPase domains
MPLALELCNFSLQVGSTLLLDTVNAHVSDGQCVALVGPNGCGKTTLLRALAGRKTDSDCYFTISAGECRRGTAAASGDDGTGSVLLVEQENLQWTKLLGTGGALDEAELRDMVIADALDMAAAVLNCGGGDEEASSTGGGATGELNAASAVDDAEAWRELSVAANDALEWRTAGYDKTPIGQLSPGCAMRAYLAIALLRRNIRLLLLDEPTNHLDLPSIMWLQHAIAASQKTVVFVSHDEAFLDAVADHIWDIDPDNDHSLTISGAGFMAFRRAKELAREQQRAAFDAQQRRHKRLTAVADKLRAATKSGEKYKGTDNDKLQRDFHRDRAGRSGQKAKAIDAFRDKDPEIQAVTEHVPLRIALDPVSAGGDASVVLGSVKLGYASSLLSSSSSTQSVLLPLPPVTLRIDFGERIAIVGFNGVGKSTLLRTMTNVIPPLAGDVALGRDLRLGVLTQEHECMPRDSTPRAYLSALVGPDDPHAGWRLLKFGLTRQQLDCPIAQLNPGARARTLLAGFSMRRVNTLILDEPTNHLDEEAISEVLATLDCFEGTIVVVSHNRKFLESIKLSRVLQLSSKGITEIESIAEFANGIEDIVSATLLEHWPQ